MVDDTQLDDVELWIALSLIKGLGSATLCQLLSRFASPDAIFSASISQLKQVVDENLAIAIHQGVDKNQIAPTLAWLQHEANHFITLADATYPKQLLEISNPPATLYAKGNLQLLTSPCIAIVGSRNATPQGEKNAENFAENLCRHGLNVVSGLALGIDGAAHRGALKANGATIAVIGTGLDIVYPAKHKTLAHQIASSGLIISEFALGTPSMAQNFPRRNRIISGLSLGCLVVEANIDSGSLITARLAAEQGREVFAIPGSIHSAVSKGCHQLIKQGAKLVESTDDIICELQTQLVSTSITDNDSSVEVSPTSDLSLEAQLVLVKMGFEPIDYESLLVLTGLNASALSTTLTLLELDGKLCNLQGAKFQRLV